MPPTLHQVVALLFVYRRICVAWIVPPLVALFAPVVWTSVLGVLNLLTGGHGLLSLILTPVLALGGYRLIHQLGGSKEPFRKNLTQNKVKFPIRLFVLSLALSRFVLGPMIVAIFGRSHWTFAVPGLATSLRLSLAMALLGLLVVFRYVGPASFSKCVHLTCQLCVMFILWNEPKATYIHVVFILLPNLLLLQCDVRCSPWYPTLSKHPSDSFFVILFPWLRQGRPQVNFS
jgi:hypothetical protein